MGTIRRAGTRDLAFYLLFSYVSAGTENCRGTAGTENQGNSGSDGVAAKKSQWDCLSEEAEGTTGGGSRLFALYALV